jgi:hypothetical protein
VTKLNKKIFALIIMTFSMLLLAPLANAQPPTVTVWTDKSEYAPGETGTLRIVFYNGGVSAVTIEEIEVIFEGWRAYINDEWQGNQTIEVNQAVVGEGVYEKDITFTVPTDGRAKSTSVDITIKTIGLGDVEPKLDPYIYVTYTPKHMEQIITLFTILVVLLIVCTIIIAATIFLSARKPQAVLRKEERAE